MATNFPAGLLIGLPAAALSWLGRQGTRAVAAIVVFGIALPPVGAALKPYVTEAVFVLLCTAFLRIDTAAFKAYMGRPAIVAAGTLWTSIAVPLLFAPCCLAFGIDRTVPDLYLALMLQAIASPMMASPALAALMGLDATLVLVTMIAGTALIPVTAPFFVYVFIGPALTLSPLALGAKLFAILAGSAVAGLALRRKLGLAAIERHKEKIDGFNIIVLFVFVAAMMEDVFARFLAAPLLVLGLTALAFLVFFAVLFLSVVVFGFAGRKRALAIGFMVSQRNMGLMLAATGGALPGLTWLYFALSQFPIYLAPYLLKPLSQRILAGETKHKTGRETAPPHPEES
jgi:hypothetical protein